MRYALALLVLMLLAACGGGDPDSENPVQPSGVPPGEDTAVVDDGTLSFEELAQDVLDEEPPPQVLAPATPASEGALPIPLPGTLVASETEEPEISGGVFDRIIFRQTGGTADVNVRFEINGQERIVVRDGVSMVVSQEVIDQIDQVINDLNFIGLQGTFMGPAASDDVYFYRVTVEKGEAARTIASQDGFMPDAYKSFLGLLRAVGDSVIVAPTSAPPTQESASDDT